MPTWHPLHPAKPNTPTPVRHLVVKSGTTAGQHDKSSACGSGWCFVRCTPTPLIPLNSQGEASGDQEWYQLMSSWPELMFYCLQYTILSFQEYFARDCLHFSYVTPTKPPDTSYTPCQPPDIPTQYRHLVVKSGKTAGQHDISSACGSGWCLVRYTPSLTNTPR